MPSRFLMNCFFLESKNQSCHLSIFSLFYQLTRGPFPSGCSASPWFVCCLIHRIHSRFSKWSSRPNFNPLSAATMPSFAVSDGFPIIQPRIFRSPPNYLFQLFSATNQFLFHGHVIALDVAFAADWPTVTLGLWRRRRRRRRRWP